MSKYKEPNAYTSQYEYLQDGEWILGIETYYPLCQWGYVMAKEKVDFNYSVNKHNENMRNIKVGKAYHPAIEEILPDGSTSDY